MTKELTLKGSGGGKVKFFTAPNIEEVPKIKHFFSTRFGGVSQGGYGTLNLGVFTEDLKENIDLNLERIFNETNINSDKLIYLSQVHGNDFYLVDDNNFEQIKGKAGDALITKEKGIAIGVFTADCVPILLVDKKENIISAIHAGWKGTDLKIVSKVLEYMQKNMGSKPENILVAIGPSIGQCCFEVNNDVAEKFKYKTMLKDRWHVDLVQENISQITNFGIDKDNIDTSKLCTCCEEELLFSYRRDNNASGRLGAFIELI